MKPEIRISYYDDAFWFKWATLHQSFGSAGGEGKPEIRAQMWDRVFFSVFLVSVALAAFPACGSEAPPATSDEGASEAVADEAAATVILNPGQTYSIDDFEAAGYKKTNQFDVETVPGATEAWFGFFAQKDIEIRIYPSHQAALDQGVEHAEFTVGKGPVPFQKHAPVRFDAFAVVGNAVMLCELEVASCEALAAQLN